MQTSSTLPSPFAQIDRLLVQFEKALIVIFFVMLFISQFVNIVARNVFGVSYHAIVEFGPAMVLWFALIGSSLTLRESRHIRFEFMLRHLPLAWQVRAHKLNSVFGALMMGTLAWFSLRFVQNEISTFGQMGYWTLILPLFFSLTAIRFFFHVIARPKKG